jgi:hypothetical protein
LRQKRAADFEETGPGDEGTEGRRKVEAPAFRAPNHADVTGDSDPDVTTFDLHDDEALRSRTSRHGESEDVIQWTDLRSGSIDLACGIDSP